MATLKDSVKEARRLLEMFEASQSKPPDDKERTKATEAWRGWTETKALPLLEDLLKAAEFLESQLRAFNDLNKWLFLRILKFRSANGELMAFVPRELPDDALTAGARSIGTTMGWPNHDQRAKHFWRTVLEALATGKLPEKPKSTITLEKPQELHP